MVLAASSEGKSSVELICPPEACEVGERVTFDGHPGEPWAPNPLSKKKVWEAVQPDLSTSDECVALWKDVAFSTKHGVCKVRCACERGCAPAGLAAWASSRGCPLLTPAAPACAQVASIKKGTIK